MRQCGQSVSKQIRVMQRLSTHTIGMLMEAGARTDGHKTVSTWGRIPRLMPSRGFPEALQDNATRVSLHSVTAGVSQLRTVWFREDLTPQASGYRSEPSVGETERRQQFLRNISKDLPDYAASHPRRQLSFPFVLHVPSI
jgi:hypothetical protein